MRITAFFFFCELRDSRFLEPCWTPAMKIVSNNFIIGFCNYLPNSSVALDRIRTPMRPYSTNIRIIGITKKMQKDNSNRGNFSGNSKSTEQNADSGIRELSIRHIKNLNSCLQWMHLSFTNWIKQQLNFSLDPKRYSSQEAYDPEGCNNFRRPLEAGHCVHMQWMTDGQKPFHREGNDCKHRNISTSARSNTLFKQIIIREEDPTYASDTNARSLQNGSPNKYGYWCQ